MDELSELGYIHYTLDKKTKKLTYQINDWVVKCSGAECMDGSVYVTEGYGFLCLPRSITQRLVDRKRTFSESDAWMVYGAIVYAGSGQYIFLFGTCRSVWTIWGRFNFGNLGTALELGKDKGMAIPAKI